MDDPFNLRWLGPGAPTGPDDGHLVNIPRMDPQYAINVTRMELLQKVRCMQYWH
jgi:hypothetical protein